MSYGEELLNNYGIKTDRYNPRYDWGDLRDAIGAINDLVGYDYSPNFLPSDTSRFAPFLEEADKWSEMSQEPRNRVYDVGSSYAHDITPSRKQAFNDALVHDLNKAHWLLSNDYHFHPNTPGGNTKVDQAKSGEYIYRMLFPDEIVAPFVGPYNK